MGPEAFEPETKLCLTTATMGKINRDIPDQAAPRTSESQRTTSSIVASLMDDFIRIPGTDIRFGLDPILGLFPGLGDTVASLVGVAIIGEASRHGVSRMALVTMALNILANAAVGSIPIVGDAFSIWFKSNRRNHDLLQKALSKAISPVEREQAVRRARLFAVFLITGVIILVVLIIWGAFTLLKLLYDSMSG